MKVKPKKQLGQHFLINEKIAEKIVNLLTFHHNYQRVLEVGPGMGVLTQFLLKNEAIRLAVIDIDRESIEYLRENFPELENKTIFGDFLEMDFKKIYGENLFAVIGNFPYNISSQILFKVYDNRQQIPEVVGMFQKEVAQRIASPPGNKEYGILSVLLQAFYDIEYAFSVAPGSFNPPPKVQSGVIRLRRNQTKMLDCNEDLFKQVVKAGFNQRRKTLRNALKGFNLSEDLKKNPILDRRAETLSVTEFVNLTALIETKT
jgi:16S rRNA (adenine1518-N6/adenine1519-N6)-dimethyltransferase